MSLVTKVTALMPRKSGSPSREATAKMMSSSH
eukprot:CAMPEP_0115340848 /NCGR_PEP_ID=MMETSP0270-20121206/91363_1 /TAXON_ID=71861 /ORGANISM="Scrippsiella trochoidea, Strain CCMP3099" /LENGTH=31 /DNA_ID= /DNA_START= /DNA_END= /DNA_ORIENTATION=